jgi:ABC-2 type transport system permease protein
MRTLLKFTQVELKLFLREPVTMFFTFALPLLFLFVMGGVFGNVNGAHFKEFRGLPAMDFYTPAYIALVLASIGVIGLPGLLGGYRERGVLRRFRASSLSSWKFFGAQGLVSLLTASVGAIIILIAAILAFKITLPQNPFLVLCAFLISSFTFSALGILLGSILPNSRSAQGVGLVLFFVMLILGGAGPPREVMTRAMQIAGDFTPLRHSAILLQDAWLGLGWNWTEFAIMAGLLVFSLTIATFLIRKNI